MHKRTVIFSLVVGLSGCAGGLEETPTEPVPAQPATTSAAASDGPEFGPCPGNTIEGCEMAILAGDPKEEGLFTIRMRSSKPFVLPPHRHPQSARVTVLKGTLNLGFGTEVDKVKTTDHGAGDFYINPANAAHFVWADEPILLQITGMGPRETIPLTHDH